MKYPMNFSCILLLVGGVVSFTFQACQSPETLADPYGHISDPEVKILLASAIEKAGGLDNWNNKKSLRFQKDFMLYEESGAIERAVLETHHYQYQPEEMIRISWEQDRAQHQLIYQEGQATKTVNGSLDENANTASLQNTILSATYVISIPFKLLDEGVLLTYEGLDTLRNGQVVKVIRGSYNPDLHENHSTPDIWWYYFEVKESQLVAYMVKHADHYSYVENESYTTVAGFLFPLERKSYRVNEKRNIQYLRAKYVYEEVKN